MIPFNSFSVASALSSYIAKQFPGASFSTSLYLSRTRRTIVIGMFTSPCMGGYTSTWRARSGGPFVGERFGKCRRQIDPVWAWSGSLGAHRALSLQIRLQIV